jgi:hypothetical protein
MKKAKVKAKKHAQTCRQCGAMLQCLSTPDTTALFSTWTATKLAGDWSRQWSTFGSRIRNYYRHCKSPEQLDAWSLGLDWEMVGVDLDKALKQIEQKELVAAE